jgi:hypothetical protein
MITHRDIDRRLLGMVRLCVDKIGSDPALLDRVRANAGRIADPRIRASWSDLLRMPWPQLKSRLLEENERGDQLRQDAPLGGLLSNAERYRFFRTRSGVPSETAGS